MKDTLRTLGALTALSLAALVGCGSPQGSVTVRTDGAIIGGEDVTDAEPFAKTVVSLVNTAQGSICTASILSKTILLTAAHCVDGDPSDLMVVFDRNIEVPDPSKLVTRQVTHFKVSPVWEARQNEPENNGDIAVVRFEGGLPAGFKAAKMLVNISLLSDGQAVTLSGYGNDNGKAGTGAGKLRWVETTIKKAGYTKSEILIEQSKGKGACHGDSGGPAYVKVDGAYALIGVTSRGVDDVNNDCSVSAAYTSVPFYAAWIKRTATALNKAAKKPAPATPAAVRALASAS